MKVKELKNDVLKLEALDLRETCKYQVRVEQHPEIPAEEIGMYTGRQQAHQ